MRKLFGSLALAMTLVATVSSASSAFAMDLKVRPLEVRVVTQDGWPVEGAEVVMQVRVERYGFYVPEPDSIRFGWHEKMLVQNIQISDALGLASFEGLRSFSPRSRHPRFILFYTFVKGPCAVAAIHAPGWGTGTGEIKGSNAIEEFTEKNPQIQIKIKATAEELRNLREEAAKKCGNG